jgi:hypothetical protein
VPGPEPRRPERWGGSAWIAGVVLIVVGVVILVQNLNLFGPWELINNPWALFILIPALGSLYQVWRDFQDNGRLTYRSRGPLVGGLVLLFVTAVFLLNLDWGKVWPVFLILAGLGALLGSFFR